MCCELNKGLWTLYACQVFPGPNQFSFYIYFIFMHIFNSTYLVTYYTPHNIGCRGLDGFFFYLSVRLCTFPFVLYSVLLHCNSTQHNFKVNKYIMCTVRCSYTQEFFYCNYYILPLVSNVWVWGVWYCFIYFFFFLPFYLVN